jgi:hypothetical protein
MLAICRSSERSARYLYHAVTAKAELGKIPPHWSDLEWGPPADSEAEDCSRRVRTSAAAWLPPKMPGVEAAAQLSAQLSNFSSFPIFVLPVLDRSAPRCRLTGCAFLARCRRELSASKPTAPLRACVWALASSGPSRSSYRLFQRGGVGVGGSLPIIYRAPCMLDFSVLCKDQIKKIIGK